MACPSCGTDRLSSPIPSSVRDLLENVPVSILLCPRCLRLDPAEDETDSYPDYALVSSALPSDPTASVAMLLLVDRLSSLALNRPSIELLVEHLESVGVDPLLALDRLAADSGLDPAVDLTRRRAQLAQLMA